MAASITTHFGLLSKPCATSVSSVDKLLLNQAVPVSIRFCKITNNTKYQPYFVLATRSVQQIIKIFSEANFKHFKVYRTGHSNFNSQAQDKANAMIRNVFYSKILYQFILFA